MRGHYRLGVLTNVAATLTSSDCHAARKNEIGYWEARTRYASAPGLNNAGGRMGNEG
jgi:hypothetical protein